MTTQTQTVESTATVIEPLPGLESATDNLPVVPEKPGVSKAEDQGFSADIDPSVLVRVSGIMEGCVMQALTEVESKGRILHQTERDATRNIQAAIYQAVLAAVSEIRSQRDVIEMFRRACNSSEAKWKELHGMDVKANLKAIDEKTQSPVKLASKYQYWKSVTMFGLGAPRRGETDLRAMYPVAHVKDDGSVETVSFDSWYTAVGVGFDRFNKTGKDAKKATGSKGKPATVTAPEPSNPPALPEGPFSAALGGEATKRAMLTVGKLQQTMLKIALIVRLADEAFHAGVQDEAIAEILSDVADLLKKELEHAQHKG